jgi:microcompartment protein CcmK/EutM
LISLRSTAWSSSLCVRTVEDVVEHRSLDKVGAEVALGIGVDEKNLLVSVGESRSDINSKRRLSDPALVVEND